VEHQTSKGKVGVLFTSKGNYRGCFSIIKRSTVSKQRHSKEGFS